MKATVLAEYDEQHRIVGVHLKDQVIGLPDHLWDTVVKEVVEGLPPGLRAILCEFEIPVCGLPPTMVERMRKDVGDGYSIWIEVPAEVPDEKVDAVSERAARALEEFAAALRGAVREDKP